MANEYIHCPSVEVLRDYCSKGIRGDNMTFPKKPRIRKLGTIKAGTVETTPVVFNGRLYRFEYCRRPNKNPLNPHPYSHFFFVDLETGRQHASFAKEHHLGCAFADGDTMYAVGVADEWGTDTLHFYRSKDLDNWEQYSEFRLEGWRFFNTGIAKLNGVYTLLFEIDAPKEEVGVVKYTFRFAQSTDLTHWTLTPSDHVFQNDRYAGGPAIYADDGWYYVFYLESYKPRGYANCVARSRDLVNWEYSIVNPVLMFDDEEDKKILSPFISVEDQEYIKRALDVNNSDFECCEFNGRTIIYYSWGDQLGHEFLAEAAYEGTMHEFLSGWFE